MVISIVPTWFLTDTSAGIGPEISQSIKDIYTAAQVCLPYRATEKNLADLLQVPIQWEEVDVTPILKGGKTVIPDAAIHSVKKNTVALKGACYHMREVTPNNLCSPPRRPPCYSKYVWHILVYPPGTEVPCSSQSARDMSR